MHEVQLHLSDQVYNRTKRRALEAGFNSVSEFIADIVSDEVSEEVENFDHLFTPERLAHIDEVIASVKAGGNLHDGRSEFRSVCCRWTAGDFRVLDSVRRHGRY